MSAAFPPPGLVRIDATVPLRAPWSARLEPGGYVDLRAEMPVLSVLSNCPAELNPATGANAPTPIRAVVWREPGRLPAGQDSGR